MVPPVACSEVGLRRDSQSEDRRKLGTHIIRVCEYAIPSSPIVGPSLSPVSSHLYQQGDDVSQTIDRSTADDPRWGAHVPWSLRYRIIVKKGDFQKFMTMLGTRLHLLFEHNEASIPNIDYFLARLVIESLGRLELKRGQTWANMVYYYFAPTTIHEAANTRTANDPEEEDCNRKRYGDPKAYAKVVAIAEATKPTRYAAHWQNLVAERLEVLQSIVVLLQQDKKHDALKSLVRDVRRIAADSCILLDFKGDPPTLVPVEEPLLQKEVLDRLLPRLETSFPSRAADLTKAYHDLLKGVDTNTVFGNAFKALEQLAREISSVPKLELSDRAALEKSFPQLHGTIRETIIKLAAHRGDEGAHGRKGPDEYEIRYLLLCICNVALVLLEYKEHCG